MNKTAILLSFLSICLALGIAVFGMKAIQGQGVAGTWTPQDQRVLAGKLKGAGLTLAAIQEYEDYVKTAPLDKKQLASLSYTIGTMYMAEGRYEKALSWLYRVEIADPETELKTALGPKIINCLERTGKYTAAEYALNKRASGKEAAGGRLVAMIGEEKVYAEEVTQAMDALPEWMKKQMAGKEGKTEYLKKYVADTLFYRKGIKLEYDKDPELRKKLHQVEKELIVNKVLEEEIKDKIKIAEDDLKNYFEANKNRYADKPAVKVSLIKSGMKEIAEKILEEIKSGKRFEDLAEEVSLDAATASDRGRFKNWVRKGEDDLGIGNAEAVTEALFAVSPGEITAPVEAGGYYYLFRVEEKRDAKIPTFTESRERVRNDYFMEKLQANYQSLLEQILKSSDVKLFPEVFAGGEAS